MILSSYPVFLILQVTLVRLASSVLTQSWLGGAVLHVR